MKSGASQVSHLVLTAVAAALPLPAAAPPLTCDDRRLVRGLTAGVPREADSIASPLRMREDG